MGLDMYLNKEKYFFKNKNGERQTFGEYKNVKKIVMEGITWRKANQIHRWFVENVQNGVDDCKEYYVDKKQLRQLLDTVNEVLKDPSLAEELLPVGEGFFFGSNKYDEYYIQDLVYTQKELEELFSSKDFEDYDYTYISSW